MTARDAPLELAPGSLGDDPAAVKDRDPVGKLVGLVQILGGQEDRDAAGDQVADAVPHRAAAARIQAGRGLVEEDHLGEPTSVIARSSRRRMPPE